MPFTATIQSIDYQNDQCSTVVIFNDSKTGWTSSKIYTFPTDISSDEATNQITNDAVAYKLSLTSTTGFQSKEGIVLTI